MVENTLEVPAMFYVFLILGALYVLYLLGYLPVSTKRSLIYVGTGGWGSQRVGASFTACSGTIRRVLRFRESRSYSFRLSGHLQQGAVTVQILDSRRCPALALTAGQPDGILSVQKGARYFLLIRFQSASGDYQLEWS